MQVGDRVIVIRRDGPVTGIFPPYQLRHKRGRLIQIVNSSDTLYPVYPSVTYYFVEFDDYIWGCNRYYLQREMLDYAVNHTDN